MEALGSIINTTGNTSQDASGLWLSTMGPLSTNRVDGIVCDHVDAKYRAGDYALWNVAPSDAEELGLKTCQANADGGEPRCTENYDHCGKAIRVTCDDPQWCAAAGNTTSIYSDMLAGAMPLNNYIPSHFFELLRAKYGGPVPAVRSVVLYITDFCPRLHSANAGTANCQGPQVDLSTAAFLLLGRRNPQGYINAAVKYKVEMLDTVPAQVGPEFSD